MFRSSRWLPFGPALALGLAAGCLVDLEPSVSCGDGVVDRSADEACDPSVDKDKWLIDCGAGTAPVWMAGDCDPETCTFTREVTQICTTCGDGHLDEGEACEAATGEIDRAALARHCRPRCGFEPQSSVAVLCEAECIELTCAFSDPTQLETEETIDPGSVSQADIAARRCCLDQDQSCTADGKVPCCAGLSCVDNRCVAR